MQLDMFGATEESAVREASPPVLSGGGAWMPPETLAFNAALHAGSLVDAVGILNRLKTGAVSRVLLASGFTVGPTDSREKVIAFVQSDILAAARLQMTGAELRMSRLAEKSGQSGSESLRPPVVAGSDLPSVVQVEGAVALENVLITKEVAVNMKAGMRVVDGEGKAYQAFSARFAYLEAFPIGADGKPQVFAGNSVFFHLDPTTANLFPDRRHEPIYLVGEISLDIPLDVVDTTSINNAISLGIEKEIENGTVGISGNLRAGTGAQDHENGGSRDSDSKPLDVGLAGAGPSAVVGGDVLRGADGTVEQGAGRSFAGTEPSAPNESGNLADARSDGISASGGRDGLIVGSARKLTREELNGLLVTDMTDDQLLQAKNLFRGDRREGAIERQIAKRAIAQEAVEEYSVVPGGDGKFTLENDEGILGGNGDGSPRKFATAHEASDWAVENGFGVVPSAPSVALDTYLPEGWLESSPGRLATNRDPVVGGIVDAETVSGKWFAIPENESIKKLEGFNSRSEVFAALQTEISALQNTLSTNPGAVKLPAMVSEAIAADVSGQNTRMDRLRALAKQSGVTLEQRVTLQEKAGLAEVALRQMRLAVFDAEDDAVKAIATGNVASFSARSVMFPGAFAAINSHVASLQSSVEMSSGDWDSLTSEEKTGTLKRSGWVTGNGDLNFIGKRLLTTAWGNIIDGSKATIRRNLPEVAAKPAEVVQDFSNASLTSEQLAGKISQFSMMRDDVSKTLRARGLSASSQQSLREKLASRQNIIDGAQAELDGRVALVRGEGASGVANSLKASPDVQLIEAGNLLSKLTNGRGDIYALAGRDSVQLRVQVMAVLMGKEKVTQAEAGVTAMRDEFYKRAGIATGQTPRGAELEFQKWVGSLAGQGVSVVVPVAALGEGAVLEPRDSEVAAGNQVLTSLDGEKDLNIGRSWNTIHGKATITSLPYPKRAESSQSALYEYTTENGMRFTVYEDKIAETIARNEHAASPEGVAEAAARDVAYQAREAAQQLASSSLAAVKAAQVAKLDGFLTSSGYSPMQAGQAKKALLSNVRFENKLMASFEFVEALAARGLERSITSENRIKPMSRSAYKRADNFEQEAHEERIKNGGKKTVYNIGGFDVGAFEYAYARHISQEVVLDSTVGAPSIADVAVASPVVDVAQPGEFSVLTDDFLQPGNEGTRGLVLPEKWEVMPMLGGKYQPFDYSSGSQKRPIRRQFDTREGAAEAAREYVKQHAKNLQPGVSASEPERAVMSRSLGDTVNKSLNEAKSEAMLQVAGPRGEYPFGKTDVEHRFHNSRVRVIPELRGDVAWDGTVMSALNGGRLISVKRDGSEYGSVRISGNRIEVLSVVDAEAAVGLDGAMPVLNSTDVPASVRDRVQWALGSLRDVESALDGVQRARGDGHILSLEVADQAVKQVRPREILAEFRKHALNNGIDADAVIGELGGEPDLARFGEAKSIEKLNSVAISKELEATAEQKIRLAFNSLPHISLGVTYPITVVHNGVTQNFLARQDAIGTGENKSAIHLTSMRQGRILRGDDLGQLVSYFKLNGKDVLSDVGYPHYATEADLKQWAEAGSQARAVKTENPGAKMSMGDEKAPWEMLSSDFRKQRNGNPHFDQSYPGQDDSAYLKDAFAAHERIVQEAVANGELVPSDVLAEYPDLKPAALRGNNVDAGAAQQVADSLVAPEFSVAPMVDYVLTDADRIGLGGLGEKFQDNLRAIQIVRTLEVEKRHAVGDELRTLARYVGWGGLKGVFDPENKQWGRQHVALRSLLSDVEWAAASRSQLDAFYTAPVVAKAMYSAVSRLGFEKGRVLEPSVGVGNFFGLMPEGMRQNSVLHGVELDVLTSQIVAALYPSAKIAKATGFQNFSVPSGYFDMAIGNPPFGSQAVVDDKGSVYSGWSIHNYFFAKSIDMLRPGGIMPMVVSHNFLDKLDPHVRQWIARRAELVSGVRLPNSAFKENANTEVVTDILVFRRLDFENTLGKTELPDWLDTTEVSIENPKTGEFENVAINNYFINKPENVLGVNSTTGSMYRANEYTVTANGDLETQLAQWVETLPKGIYVPLERSIKDIESAAVAVEIPDFVKEGSFFLNKGVVLMRLQDRGGEQVTDKWEAPNLRAFDRMTGMIQIRDGLRQQMRLERSVESGDIEASRIDLNRLYDNFKKNYGLLNDPINRRLFLADTESSLIQALEFEYEKALTPAKAEEYGVEPRASRAVKADIFSRRVLFPPGEIEVVQTAKDALLHSLNNTGGVDMAFMQSAYGKAEQEIISELGDLLFVDPVEGLVTADQYLSGDVKTKLVEVTKAARSEFSLSRNVDALTKIIPVDKLPSEIHAAIGAAWVPPQIFTDFAKEISGGNISFVYVGATGQWIDRSLPGAVNFSKNNHDYGTEKLGAVDIFSMAMNSRAPEIRKKAMIDGEEVSVIDEEGTEAVRQRADKIKAHWDSWLWQDGPRADKLASIYNDKFNRTVERKYDGSHLTFPGMSPSMALLLHQKNGVWRGLQDRVMLMDQVVGAGKTYEGVAMMMEMRRLGIAKKPLIAVPNHLTLQWRSEFYKLYPGANVLAATPQDFDKENRERFFSKIVTGNWDAVIVGHSSLKKISVPLEAEMKIITEQYEDIAEAILSLKRERGDARVVRDMEKIKDNLKAKIARLVEKGGKKDNVVDFADLGVDALFIDEMHEFKNLFFTTQMTKVAGLGNPVGSGKAFDLFTKVRWLQDTFGDKAPLITATGTPISNSLAEMFTMQRYMQYSSLKANNLHVFDAWAKQYGDVQNVYEVAPSGTGYRMSQRFSKFKNLSSLMGEYRSFADVITLDHLKAQETALGKVFPVPKLDGGKPLNIIAQRSELQEKFFGIPEIVRNEDGTIRFEIDLDMPTQIVKSEVDGKFVLEQKDSTDRGEEFTRRGGARYETQEEAAYMTALAGMTPVMTIDPNSIVGQFDNLRALMKASEGKINALSLTSLANKAGLDYRLIDPNAVDFPESKVNIAVGNILEIGKKWESDKGVQLVFCDLSVPLSAKSKMASKEKRVYVRDDKGELTHKKGTLHSVKGHDGLPYFLVAVGKGNSKTFTMYDPHTGQVLKNGLDSKSDGHDMAKRALLAVGGPDRWMEMRDRSAVISPDDIDEYKNEHTLDADGDAGDLEISKDDIEGSTGVAGFSIYDDMKAKLVAGGMPANQIEFIHDHDTPQAKDLLFKRVNAGDVRVLFGSTPKMGAGTNVQKKLVALHHIDAPWRPSDLEQREGRIIRRGNSLYERDPVGFVIQVNRYATAQTYDTRRWQLLEHKASGLEQLRNYSGVNEMDDVANEASNSADMKAAASGNPLILKETQLSNEVKKLRLLERAHRDGMYMMRSRISSNRVYASSFGPNILSSLETLQVQRDTSQMLGIYGSKKLTNKEEVMLAIDDINAHVSTLKASKSLVYRGLKFDFDLDVGGKYQKMTTPDGQPKLLETFSRSGIVTRMDNWCNGIESEISFVTNRIEKSIVEADELEKKVGNTFDQADDLLTAISEHGKVQRSLMKSNALSAVKAQDAEEFKIAVELQKSKLRQHGFGEAVSEIENGDGLGHESNEGVNDVANVGLSGVVQAGAAEVLDVEVTQSPAVMSLVQHGDQLASEMPGGMLQELVKPSITLRNGNTVSKKEYVDGLFVDGYSKAEYYKAPKGSHAGFLLNAVTGSKVSLDSVALYYADRTIMNSLKDAEKTGLGLAVLSVAELPEVVAGEVPASVAAYVNDLQPELSEAVGAFNASAQSVELARLDEVDLLEVGQGVVASLSLGQDGDQLASEMPVDVLAGSVVAAWLGNATVVPPLNAIYKLESGGFAKFEDGVWFRGENTAHQAMKTEMVSSAIVPKNRFADENWILHCGYAVDEYGATVRLKPVANAAEIAAASLGGIASPVVSDTEKYHYMSGVLGMEPRGVFTRVESNWVLFDKATAIPMQEQNLKPARALDRGVFVGAVSKERLVISKGVTPQVPSGDMELYIKVAADSIGELRKTDVYRVLVESNRSEFRQAIASYIKAERPDLVREVDDVMDEARAEALAKQNGVQAVSSLGSAANEPCVEIDHIKTRMVDALSVDLPDGWIVMNAPRPLLGTKSAEGDFVSGRFYAAIDPMDSMAKKYIEENIKLDARLLVVVSRDTQMNVALHGNEYRDQYMEREAGERYEMLSSQLEKLRDKPYGELSKLILEAKGVVNDGLHVGQVLDVANGVVTQKINRDGGVVCHDASKLSSVVGIGDMVDVQYRGGQGVVSGIGKGVAVGR